MVIVAIVVIICMKLRPAQITHICTEILLVVCLVTTTHTDWRLMSISAWTVW